jgi:hypothetical protein
MCFGRPRRLVEGEETGLEVVAIFANCTCLAVGPTGVVLERDMVANRSIGECG